SKVDKDGNPVYEVGSIEVSYSEPSGTTYSALDNAGKAGTVSEYYPAYDEDFKNIAIQPTKYVVNVDYEQALKDYNIVEGQTTKFTTIFGDVLDWYIYTLGGIPIPSYADGYESPILMLSDSSHDHGFTYAKKFDTPLSGKSTIEARLMIKGETLDPMNQAPELRFYLQQDAADSDNADADEGETAVDTGSATEAATFGTIVSITFSKNDINYDGEAISRYSDDTWYDLKLLLDGDNGTCSVYINDKLVRSDLEYSEAATSNTIARWQISSRLAGTEDVYVAYMKAYTGWEEPVTDPDATPKPDNTVQEGTSGSRPSSGGGGGGGGSTAVTPTATPDPNATPDPDATAAPDAAEAPSSGSASAADKTAAHSFKDMTGYDWADEAVAELSGRGIVNGISDTEFAPGRNITRAEFITLLMRGFDLIDENAVCSFEDVAKNAWYYSSVATAYSLGVVNGVSDTEFGSDSNISRQDMAVMITRLLANQNLALTRELTYEAFADESSIADYAAASVKTLYEAGIIDGIGDNLFDPRGTTTRAAAAKVLYGTLKPMWD
ncbi:MAG: S-layer homology domain-containing protein, partial [Candidatus Ornithomonoglobus sp.]